jgi:hypothetical protein
VLNAVPRAILDREVAHALRIRALASRVLASPIYQHFADGAPGADLVVIDAPASGHGLALLAAPLLMSEVITTGPLGRMAAKIAALVKDPARCAIVLPTLAEEMAVQETTETIGAIRQRLGREPSLVVANAIFPPVERAGPASSREEDPDITEAQALWTTRRRLNEAELARLAEAWTGRTARVPLVAADFGPGLLTAVAGALEPQIEAAPPARRRKVRA